MGWGTFRFAEDNVSDAGTTGTLGLGVSQTLEKRLATAYIIYGRESGRTWLRAQRSTYIRSTEYIQNY